jgi:hypothetical protein
MASEKHVHSFGPRGRGACPCGLTPEAAARPSPAAVHEVWIIVDAKGAIVAEGPFRSEARAMIRIRRDWGERVIGPYVLAGQHKSNGNDG